jgi:hypothetical protein
MPIQLYSVVTGRPFSCKRMVPCQCLAMSGANMCTTVPQRNDLRRCLFSCNWPPIQLLYIIAELLYMIAELLYIKAELLHIIAENSGAIIHNSGAIIHNSGAIIHNSGAIIHDSGAIIHDSGAIIHDSGANMCMTVPQRYLRRCRCPTTDAR